MNCPTTVANCPVGYSSVYMTSYTVPVGQSYTTSHASFTAVPSGNATGTGSVQFTGAGTKLSGKVGRGSFVGIVLLALGAFVVL